MAFCKRCNREISEGKQYCDDCLKKVRADESYLDVLLNSVATESEDKAAAIKDSKKKEKETEPAENRDIDKEILQDAAEADLLLNGLEDEKYSIFDEAHDDEYFDKVLDDEAGFNKFKKSTFLKKGRLSKKKKQKEEKIEKQPEKPIIEKAEDDASDLEDSLMSDFSVDLSKDMDLFENEATEEPQEESQAEIKELPTEEPKESSEQTEEAKEETVIPDFFSDLTEDKDEGVVGAEAETEKSDSNDDDLRELLGGLYSDSDEGTSNSDEEDFGDILDLDKKVSIDDTDNADDADILKMLSDLNESRDSAKENEGTLDDGSSELYDLIGEAGSKGGKGKKKQSILKKLKDTFVLNEDGKNRFEKLFGNVVEKRTPEEIAKLKEKAIAEIEAKEERKLKNSKDNVAAKETQKKSKEEKAAQDKEKKLAKEKAAADSKRKKEEQKKEAKDKKELAKKRVLEEIDEYEGKINKAGATLIFLVFATALLLLVGVTNIYTYNVAIKRATFDFNSKRYNEAYEDIAGIEILEDDMGLYERIMTVMYVNKQLNSFYNFTVLGNRDLALDSLLKGLMRYDKYIAYARQLDITEHMDYVKQALLTELKNEYNLDEAAAYSIIELETQEEYSERVIQLSKQ